MRQLVERKCTQEWQQPAVTTLAYTLSGSIVNSYLLVGSMLCSLLAGAL